MMLVLLFAIFKLIKSIKENCIVSYSFQKILLDISQGELGAILGFRSNCLKDQTIPISLLIKQLPVDQIGNQV